MKFKLPDSVTRKATRQLLLTKKHSPTILFVGGVVGVLTATVMASKATLKVEQLLDDHQSDMNDAKEMAARERPDYTEQDYKKDVVHLYIQSAAKLTKLYGPSIVLIGLSIGMLTKSHNLLSQRNAGLAAAYSVAQNTFMDYRGRVVAELGDEKDREFLHGTETVTVTKNDNNGPKKVKSKTFGDGGGSRYAKLFDERNGNWDPHPEYNIMFLRGVQQQCNDRLSRRGHLFLNEVYTDLGMDHTKDGAVTGWVFKDTGKGDGYVSFGIFDDNSMTRLHKYVTGVADGSIWLDFNVDGSILDEI